MQAPAVTMGSQILARLGDHRPGLYFEDATWTWHEVVVASLARAALIRRLLEPDREPHVGVMLDNVPDYVFWLGGAALAGATIVGLNPTRRGSELARDIAHTDCQLIVTEPTHLDLLPKPPAALAPVLDIASDAYRHLVADPTATPATATPAEAAAKQGLGLAWSLPAGDTRFALLFTSGSTSAPKAVPCSNERAGAGGLRAARGYGVSDTDVVYCPMPLFHGNALIAGWSVAVAAAAPIVLRRRFSASRFLDDARRYGCTYFTYVGRTVSYLLAQPPRNDDRHHQLRLGFGTEASTADRAAFQTRFGVELAEGYGSSESAIVILPTPDTPAGSLGRPRPDLADSIAVINPATRRPCPPGIVDDDGRLLNPSEAIGELVNTDGGGPFTGYYNNPEATAQRLRGGWYWSGDLAWRDPAGFFWFAGRTDDWLRVDGENMSAAPIAELIARCEGIAAAVVHAVPDERTGDQIMVQIELSPDTVFDPAAFAAFLNGATDLGTKWAPRYVRVVDQLPTTANHKIDTGSARRLGRLALAGAATDPDADPAADPAPSPDGRERASLWWRPARHLDYVPFTPLDRDGLIERFTHHGRLHHLTSD